jgi:osmotically inducible protein OsmC
LRGKGTIDSVGSGALGDLPVTWAARTESSNGMTSPEELIAAAHASCFSMALSNILAKGGNTPEQVNVTAVATFEKLEPGWRITRMDLTVVGRVPGLDDEGFEKAVAEAKAGCPVSNALSDSIKITAEGRLEK